MIINYFSNHYFIFIKKTNSLIKQIYKFKSYCEFYEDLILFCIFSDVENGFYIDVGANDPVKGSVTNSFYLKGWNGINIEPLPEPYKLLMKNRKNDINLNIGVGNKKGYSLLYLAGYCSTLNRQYLKKRNNNKTITIKIDTMTDVCKKYVKRGQDIQFCKIDVEGEEKNVLLGYDFVNFRPKIFCIESTFPKTLIPSYSQWEYILLNNGYSFVYQYKINRFYLDNNFSYLKKKFLDIDKYIKFILFSFNSKRFFKFFHEKDFYIFC